MRRLLSKVVVFRGLLIYAAAIGAIVAGIAVTMRVPLDTALGIFAIGVTAVLSVAGPVLIVRNLPKRQPRQDVPHIGCDPVAPPLVAPWNPYIITIEAPERKLLEAPRKEIQAP